MCPLYTDMKKQFPPVDSADVDRITSSLGKGFSLERPTVSFSSDTRYLTSLLVFGGEEPCKELHLSGSSQFTSIGLELGAANIVSNHQKIQGKIVAVLKLLTFREKRVLVQFWSPHEVGKCQLLTTIDQPYGIGVIDGGLHSYRRVSEHNSFVVNEDHEKEDLSPPARVFRRGLPEWTPDVNSYLPKHFPQQDDAIRCSLHGYCALPVFDPVTELCVGVLELLTSSKYMNYAYEVQQIDMALKKENLTSRQVFDFHALYVPNERRQNDLDIIHGVLKVACDVHSLPLAQMWAVSQHTSFVSIEKVIKKSCSSFDTRCVGKVCMSTVLSHVKDLGTWPFRKACRERHLDRSSGLVGKALLSRGSCCCGDVTKLSEEEYPLVHYARMNGLTSCFAIFLHSVEADDEYVLEFFLPPDIKSRGHVLNLVQTLKQNIPVDSGFELGDSSCIQVVGPPTDLSVNMEPDVIQTTSSDSVADNFVYLMDSGSPSGETSKPCKKRKRKIDMVTVEVSFNGYRKKLRVPISLGLGSLKHKVAQRFELQGKRLRLKYRDEQNDLILIACNDDWKSVSGSSSSLSLICLAD